MLYKVPQKIDLEDKVIGPLTFRQFLYLLCGFLPSFIIAKILESTSGLNIITGIIIMFPLWLPAIFLAFGKFQEQNVDQIVVALLNFVRSPKKLIWNKNYNPTKVLIKAPRKEEINYGKPDTLESRLQDLSDSISIYGVKPQTNGERITAHKSANLLIKTKVKPVKAILNEEKHLIPEQELQKEFGLSVKEKEEKSQNQTPQKTSLRHSEEFRQSGETTKKSKIR